MSTRDDWSAKVDFVATRLASDAGHDWGRLPAMSRWFASKARFRHAASLAIGSANLWDMYAEYREKQGENTT